MTKKATNLGRAYTQIFLNNKKHIIWKPIHLGAFLLYAKTMHEMDSFFVAP